MPAPVAGIHALKAPLRRGRGWPEQVRPCRTARYAFDQSSLQPRPMLTIDDLTVRVAGRVLIDHASAQIPTAARVGLVGRDGTGKTTLFNVITGELHAETG